MATIPDSITSPAFATPQATAGACPLSTIADVLKLFPGMPPERIRLSPIPGTATEADVIALDDHHDILCELIDGILIEKTMGLYESRLAAVLAQILGNYCDEHDLGIVVGEAGMMKILPDQVRIPDMAFISWSKLPDRIIPRIPLPRLFPDLAIEVLSQSNSTAEMKRKLQDYFEAGVHLVWHVDPVVQTISVFTSPTNTTVHSKADEVDGGTVLPGFKITVADIFARAEPGRKS